MSSNAKIEVFLDAEDMKVSLSNIYGVHDKSAWGQTLEITAADGITTIVRFHTHRRGLENLELALREYLEGLPQPEPELNSDEGLPGSNDSFPSAEELQDMSMRIISTDVEETRPLTEEEAKEPTPLEDLPPARACVQCGRSLGLDHKPTCQRKGPVIYAETVE